MISVIACSIIYFIAVFIFHYCAIRKGPLATVISKGISSIFFIVIAALAFPISCDNGEFMCTFHVGVIVGLVFGLFGDVLLALRNVFKQKKSTFILSGIVAFAIGHICYLAVIALNMLHILPDNMLWLSMLPVVLGVPIGITFMKLAPKFNLDFGKLKAGVCFYGALLATMVLSAIVMGVSDGVQNGFGWFAVVTMLASVLFVSSDIILSKSYFDKSQKDTSAAMIIAIHVTYYLAQYLFAISAAGPALFIS